MNQHRRAPKSFVSQILTSKFFDIRILRGISNPMIPLDPKEKGIETSGRSAGQSSRFDGLDERLFRGEINRPNRPKL